MEIRLKARPSAVARLWIALSILAVLLATFRPARAEDTDQSEGFQFVGGPVELTGAPGIYEWRFLDKVGESFYDKIALHRIAHGPREQEHRDITVLYLPGTNMNGEISIDNPRYALPVYLATHGADVWTLDYRTHFVAPSDTAVAISYVFKRWTDDVFASDIAAAASFILSQTQSQKLFVVGFSRGVEFAYLFAAMHPDEVRGVVALDGFIPRHPSEPVPEDRVVDDIGGKNLTYEKRHFLMQSVIDDPDGPAPIPKYRTARENLVHVLYDAKEFGGQGGLSNALNGYADPTIVARLLIGYDRYWPAVQDYENPFTPPLLAALKASKIPVIAFASTNIAADWPAWVVQAAHSTGSDDVTFKRLDGWGHLDVLCGTQAESDVFAPTMEWLTQHRK
ncbi:MAG: alpha/beta hydrolase [Candidatus Binataceae bacterium]